MQQRKIALFDIDKTIFDGYIIFLLAREQEKARLIQKHSADNLLHDLDLYNLYFNENKHRGQAF